MDWFLYDNGLRHERVNSEITENLIQEFCNIYYLNSLCKIKPSLICGLRTKSHDHVEVQIARSIFKKRTETGRHIHGKETFVWLSCGVRKKYFEKLDLKLVSDNKIIWKSIALFYSNKSQKRILRRRKEVKLLLSMKNVQIISIYIVMAL